MGMVLLILAIVVPIITVLTVALLIGLIASLRNCKKDNTLFNWLLAILLSVGFIASFYYFCILWYQVFAIIEIFR
jgi:amino acid permease